jgi:hypothetical protein
MTCMHLPPPGEAEAISRLTFVSTSAAWKLTSLAAGRPIHGDILPGASTNQNRAFPAWAHAFLTPEDAFHHTYGAKPWGFWEVMTCYKIEGPPVTIVCDPQGNVMDWRTGGISKSEFLTLLDTSSPSQTPDG